MKEALDRGYFPPALDKACVDEFDREMLPT